MTFTLLHQPGHLSLKKWLWDFDWFLWPMQNMNFCPWWPYPTLTSSYISNIQNTCYFLTFFWQVQFRCIKCRCWRAFKMQNTGYRLSQILKKNLAQILFKCHKKANKSVKLFKKILTTQTDHFYFLGLLERKRQEFWWAYTIPCFFWSAMSSTYKVLTPSIMVWTSWTSE